MKVRHLSVTFGLDVSNAVSKPSRRPLHEAQLDSDIKHLLEQTSSPDSVVCLRIIEEHMDGSFLIFLLKAIANELGQSEALVGGTSEHALICTNHTFKMCGSHKAFASTTMFKKCGVRLAQEGRNATS